MGKQGTLAWAILLLMGLAGTTSAAVDLDDPAVDQRPDPYGALLTPNVGVQGGGLPVVEHSGFGTCGGVAPVTTSCVSGAFISEDITGHTLAAGPAFSGTLTSKLVYDVGARTWTCLFEHGVQISCEHKGFFPPEDALFEHQCIAEPSSEVSAGPWGCTVQNANVPLPE